MLEEVDKPGSEIDLYVDSQEEILDSKLQEIEQMKKALNLFKNNCAGLLGTPTGKQPIKP